MNENVNEGCLYARGGWNGTVPTPERSEDSKAVQNEIVPVCGVTKAKMSEAR